MNRLDEQSEISTEEDLRYVPPIDKQRRSTNNKSLIIFCIFMVVYAGISIYAFSKGNTNNLHLHNNTSSNNNTLMIKKILDRMFNLKWIILGSSACSIFLTLSLIFTIRTIPGILIKVALSWESIEIIADIYFLFLLWVHTQRFFFDALLYILIFLLILIIKIYALYKVGFNLVNEIVKESCRAVFASPISILLTTVTSFLTFCVLVFSALVLINLNTIDVNEEISWPMIVLHIINVYSAIWLSLFIMGYGHMVLYGTFSTWYWTENRISLVHNNIIKNFIIVCRYHLGTIAYGTSIWIVFVSITIFIKALRNKVTKSKENILILLVAWYTILSKLADDGIGVTAIYGLSFKKSARIACDIYLRHSLRYLTIIGWMASIASLLFSIALTGFDFVYGEIHEQIIYTRIVVMIVCIFLFIFPAFVLLYGALSSIFFCILEDHERNQGNTTDRSFMSHKLKTLMSR